MGCLKLSYRQAGEGIGQTAFFSGGNLEEKGGALKNRYNYYPFGLTFNSYQRSYGKVNNFKYNGKEEQKETGWYDFHARMYDAALGRFVGIDPFADIIPNYNPYHYVYNNPIVFTDPTGMLPKYNWGTGNYEDDNGNVISYEETLAAHGISIGGTAEEKNTKDEGDNTEDNQAKSLKKIYHDHARIEIDINFWTGLRTEYDFGSLGFKGDLLSTNWLTGKLIIFIRDGEII